MNMGSKTPRTQALRERDYEADVAVWLHAEDLELETVALNKSLNTASDGLRDSHKFNEELRSDLARVTAERDAQVKIKEAEKKILLNEVANNATLRASVAELEAALRQIESKADYERGNAMELKDIASDALLARAESAPPKGGDK